MNKVALAPLGGGRLSRQNKKKIIIGVEAHGRMVLTVQPFLTLELDDGELLS